MPVSTDAVIRVSGKEPGTRDRRELTVDPLPIDGGGVEISTGGSACIVGIADLREALDRAEHIQREDGTYPVTITTGADR